MSELKYYKIFKPFGMMSQFSRENENPVLSDLKFEFPKDVYPVGRLDADSEGLLLLTNDKKLNHKLLNPAFAHKRTYLAQLDGEVTEEAISKLRKGVEISINGKKHKTLPAIASKTAEPEWLPDRNPPVRFRKNIPTSWIELSLKEGKNRQVRKMTAAVGFPTLRLLRISIEEVSLIGMKPGNVKEICGDEIYKLLKIK